jgi:hypothetical protein
MQLNLSLTLGVRRNERRALMSQLAKFPLKNGGFLALEVDGAGGPGGPVKRGSAFADAI